MRGILADHNNEGHVALIMSHLQSDRWRGLWSELNLPRVRFADLDLTPHAPDDELWQACQLQQILLITNNRNARGPTSLEATLWTRNSPASLPVFTIANPDRLLFDGAYLDRVVERLLEYLIDIDNFRGTGRLYLP